MKTTGLSRKSKELAIAEIEKQFKSRVPFFITRYGTVSASSMDGLRANLRKNKGRYLVVKGSLGRKALERADLKNFTADLKGACGIAFAEGDPVLSTKVLVEFAKANEGFAVEKGFFNGEVLGPEQIKLLASLPSREVLLSRVAAGIQAPISRLVGVLAAMLRKMVTVLDALAKKKSEQDKDNKG